MILSHATIREVAERAQVSTATVSRILRGKSGHRSATVENVRRVAREIDKELELSKNSLQLPPCVGIILAAGRDFLNTHYNSTLLSAIMETLTDTGYIGQLLPRHYSQMDFEFFKNVVAGYRLKGLLIPEFETVYDVSRELQTLNIPIVTIGNLNGSMRHSVYVDDCRAGQDAATYLWSLGHRRFGLLSMSTFDISQRQRLAGFMDTVREAGGRVEDIWKKEFRNHTDSTTLTALELSQMKNAPTALFSTNSVITQRLIADLSRLGIRTPEDYSIVSYEENNELEYLPTPVTVISQPTRGMGTQSVNMLLRLLEGLPVEQQLKLDYALTIRESTKRFIPKERIDEKV